MSQSPLQQLSDVGQSVRVDFLSRRALQDGTIARLMRKDAVVGLTSNPSISQKAIAEGDAYDEQPHEVLEHETDGKEVLLALAAQDVRDACDLLRETWERTDHLDGQVSLEVGPRLTHDREGTIAEAKRLHELVEKDAGVDYDRVTARLEDQGVQKFLESFQELFSDVKTKRDALAAAR